MGAFTASTLMPPFPLPPKAGSHPLLPLLTPSPAQPPAWALQPPKPPVASSSARQTHPALRAPPPHGKINFLKRRRLGLCPFTKPSALARGQYNHLLGGILDTKGVTLGFLRAHHLPSRHPQTAGTIPKHNFFNFPPRLIINKLLQLRTERRKSSNFEALGISKSRAKIQNKCSFMLGPPFFPLSAVLLNHGILSEASTPS